MTKKIAVLLGGNSSEREISLMSGKAILNALKKSNINAFGIDPLQFPLLYLKKYGFTKIFIALHGKGGEDGILQGVLEYLNIPYTGSGVLASSITMNKFITKNIWKENNLPVCPHYLLRKKDFIKKNHAKIKQQILKLNLPIFIKPNCTGSSLGISKVNNINYIFDAIEKAFIYDTSVLFEKYIEGTEFTVGILHNKVLPPIRVEPINSFYNYQAKYYSNSTQFFCPSGLDYKKEKELSKIALDAWNIVECSGWGRIDVILDTKDHFQLLEINTVPGMTSHSLYPMAAKKIGLSFQDLVLKILNLTDK
ncbi:D-alanine--D-alanine ligase [Enterobacteriaceae endosymbiont of Donacia tomentosa]|uniref:D-alanine--D-alanine ligase n=1 Tax=Enterobacteriaceae endosymbiont of Donacia tomentosa TaxID=2675787 RepID=UPI00144A2A48|nr:D-alanine--D-alanine ligase [Enterobacteriaceae endosymbiont of Donacia tomentosa]QJC31591.1 D-alanine--D-alanine ligase [Enterobacteriaceae endosymbiont of Donacia tomentosa]